MPQRSSGPLRTCRLPRDSRGVGDHVPVPRPDVRRVIRVVIHRAREMRRRCGPGDAIDSVRVSRVDRGTLRCLCDLHHTARSSLSATHRPRLSPSAGFAYPPPFPTPPPRTRAPSGPAPRCQAVTGPASSSLVGPSLLRTGTRTACWHLRMGKTGKGVHNVNKPSKPRVSWRLRGWRPRQHTWGEKASVVGTHQTAGTWEENASVAGTHQTAGTWGERAGGVRRGCVGPHLRHG